MIASALLTAGLLVNGFDHGYQEYAALLARHVRADGVHYQALAADRAALKRAVAAFDAADTRGEATWSRQQRLAFWINAYNLFTLDAIVDHYPIRAPLFTLQPRNSIRQIDGVWTTLTWRAAGRTVTLDDIEHRILRPTFGDARIHFAVNCASASCPPLATEPYRADTLDRQLDAAARRYLQSAHGLQVSGSTLRVSSIFKWYGDDFIAQFAPLVSGERAAVERAILGVVQQYGAAAAAAAARTPSVRLRFLDYDWSLNDISGR